MLKENIKDILEDEFKNDPVRKEITYANLDEDLFTNGIVEMHPDTTYSTTEAAKIIGRSDSTIRNYFRTDLVDYIEAERFGKFYRLNYKSIFKLHMILLLIEKGGKSTSDIAYFVGVLPSVSVSNGGKRSGRVINDDSSIEEYNNKLDQIEQVMKHFHLMLDQSNSHIKYLEQKEELNTIEKNLYNCNYGIDKLNLRIEQLKIEKKLKSTEEKNYRLLDLSLRNTQTKSNNGILGSFLSAFKGSDKVNVGEVIKSAREEVNNDNTHDKHLDIDQEINEIKESIKLKIEDRDKFKKLFEIQQKITNNTYKLMQSNTEDNLNLIESEINKLISDKADLSNVLKNNDINDGHQTEKVVDDLT